MAVVGTLLVNLKARSADFERKMKRARHSVGAFGRASQRVGKITGRALRYAGLAAAAVGVVAARAYMKQEKAEKLLDAALRTTGASVARHGARLRQMAREMQKATVYGDEFTLALMRQGINLGVNAEAIGDTTRMAIGLATALEMDLATAMRYTALATMGEMTMLRRYIPELRSTADATKQLAIVQRVANAGWRQAQEEIKTVAGRLEQMKNRLGDIAERIGAALIPALDKGLEWIDKIATRLEGLSQREIEEFGAKLLWVGKVMAGVWVGAQLATFAAHLVAFKGAALAAAGGMKILGVAAIAAAAPFAGLAAAIALPVVVLGGLALYYRRQAAQIEADSQKYADASKKLQELAQTRAKAEQALEKARVAGSLADEIAAMTELTATREAEVKEIIRHRNELELGSSRRAYLTGLINQESDAVEALTDKLAEQIKAEQRLNEIAAARAKQKEEELKRAKMLADAHERGVAEITRLENEITMLVGTEEQRAKVERAELIRTLDFGKLAEDPRAQAQIDTILDLMKAVEKLKAPEWEAFVPPWQTPEYAEEEARRRERKQADDEAWMRMVEEKRPREPAAEIGRFREISTAAEARGLAAMGRSPELAEAEKQTGILTAIEGKIPWPGQGTVLPWQN